MEKFLKVVIKINEIDFFIKKKYNLLLTLYGHLILFTSLKKFFALMRLIIFSSESIKSIVDDFL